MSTQTRRIAVASGKGGVGKTWLSIALASVLARMGRRILLVDCDFGLANVDVQLGLATVRDLGAWLDGEASLADVITRHEAGRFDVVAGRAGSGALASLSPSAIEDLLDGLATVPDYDLIVLDLGAGIDRSVRRLACWADTLVVIATDEPTSLTDAYVMMKVHVQDRTGPDHGMPDACRAALDMRLVVNQAASSGAGEQTFATLARVCANYLRHSPVLAGIVRRDDRVRDAIRNQTPSPLRFPTAISTVDVEALARTIDRAGGLATTPNVVREPPGRGRAFVI